MAAATQSVFILSAVTAPLRKDSDPATAASAAVPAHLNPEGVQPAVKDSTLHPTLHLVEIVTEDQKSENTFFHTDSNVTRSGDVST